MVIPENRVDKSRFEQKKGAKTSEGMEEQKAIEEAAEEVKELRKREGRSKDEDRGDETKSK